MSRVVPEGAPANVGGSKLAFTIETTPSVVPPQLEVVPGNEDSAQTGTVCWQWKHQTGWRDYDDRVNEKIERAYQKGEQKVRVKTGKTKKVPMEIFFLDNPMKQFDPTTKNTREVRRLGPSGMLARMKLRANRMTRALETGYTNELAEKSQEIKRQYSTKSSVMSYYNKQGWCAFIAKSDLFFASTMLAVVFNGLWMAYDADFNSEASISDAKPEFQIVENALCVIFTSELLIRFGAFKVKSHVFSDAWFRLDFVLVTLMVFETWLLPLTMLIVGAGKSNSSSLGNLSILRIVRLMRLARMTRLLRICPEVVTLLKGIAKAVRTVLLAMSLLWIALYVSAIVCRALVQDYAMLESSYFSSVSHSLATLLLYCTFLDSVANLLHDAWADGGLFITVFLLLVIFLSCFTILNMLTGILCEVVSNVSNNEKEAADVTYLKANLLQLMEAYDAEDNQKLGKDEFGLLMQNPDVVRVLKSFGVAPDALLDIIDLLFEASVNHKYEDGAQKLASQDFDSTEEEEPPAIDFEDFIHLVSSMRGSNRARVKDVVELREYWRQCVKRLEWKITRQDLRSKLTTLPLQRGLSCNSNKSRTGDDIALRRARTRTDTQASSEVGKEGNATVVIEANFVGQISFHRHSSLLNVGEFLEQLAPELCELKAMDSDGKELAKELCVGDILGNGTSNIQGQLAVQLRLVSLARVQEFAEPCKTPIQLYKDVRRSPDLHLACDPLRAQVEEQGPSPPTWPRRDAEDEKDNSLPPVPTSPPPQLPAP